MLTYQLKLSLQTLNPTWGEEFVFRVIPSEHKLVLQVFDENRLTRDDFLGLIELQLLSLPKEADCRTIPPKKFDLQPRSQRSKVKGYLNIYAAFIPDPSDSAEGSNGTTESNGNAVPAEVEAVTAAAAAITVNASSAPPPPHSSVTATAASSSSSSETDGSWEILQPDAPAGGPGPSSSQGEAGGPSFRTNSSSSSNNNNNPDSSTSLPQGWEERQDANGRTYYVNHNEKTTQWERPVPGCVQIWIQLIKSVVL